MLYGFMFTVYTVNNISTDTPLYITKFKFLMWTYVHIHYTLYHLSVFNPPVQHGLPYLVLIVFQPHHFCELVQVTTRVSIHGDDQ